MHYERAEPGFETTAYAFLHDCLSRRRELNRQNNNRSALVASRGNDNPTKPSAPGPKAKPEGRVKSRGMSKGRDGVGGDAILQPFPTYASHFGKLAHALEGNIVHSSTKGARQPRGRQRRKAKAKPDREDSPGQGRRDASPAGKSGKRKRYNSQEVEICEFDPAFGRHIGPERWIADTGCGDDLIGHADLTPQDWQDVEQLDSKLCLYTPNGTVCSDQALACEPTRKVVKAVVLTSSPYSGLRRK